MGSTSPRDWKDLEPGAICLSEQAYWQVKGRLDLKVIDLGPIELKNIAESNSGLFVAGRRDLRCEGVKDSSEPSAPKRPPRRAAPWGSRRCLS